MTISIIGCGWLGLPLGEALAKVGHRVKGSTTTTAKVARLEKAGIDPYIVELTPNFEANREGFLRESTLLIVNIPPRNRNGEEDFHLRQLASLRSVSEQEKVSYCLLVSSTGVYPDLNRVVTEEDASAQSLSRGGVPLLAAEEVFRSAPDIQTTVVRFGGLYGPQRHPGRFLAGKKELPGADNPVNMIHLEDCVGAIQAIINRDLWGETFSVCSPHHPTRRQFYEKAAKELGIEPPSFSGHTIDFKEVGVNKFIEATGYEFRH